jgi:hypothetical protein
MKPHDLFEGWRDKSVTQHREYWRDGVKGRHGHRSGISPDSPHDGFQEPWGSFPDLAENDRRMSA